MMSPLQLFTHLVYNSQSELWHEDELPKLKVAQLHVLAVMIGAPKSGTKENLIITILARRHVRLKIGGFGSTREEAQRLANAYRKESLKAMAKECKLWRSGSKIQLAICLLGWRDRARLEGQKALEACVAATREETAADPQLKLPL